MYCKKTFLKMFARLQNDIFGPIHLSFLLSQHYFGYNGVHRHEILSLKVIYLRSYSATKIGD